MQPRFIAAALVLLACCVGAHAAASPESVDRLLQLMQVQSQIEMVYSQAMPAAQQRMGPTMQRVMQVAREEAEKEQAKSAPKR